jgi:hypothetical protein
MIKLELISCQASSDATAQLSSDTSRTVLYLGTALLLDLFTGLPLAGGPAFSGASSETGGICTGLLVFLPSFQGPFCPIISLPYLLLAVWPNGLLYSA